MEYAIEILTNQLHELNNKASEEDEEDDLIGAVVNNRKTYDVRLALKILHEFIQNHKTLNAIS